MSENYIYLNFKGKLPSNLFENDVFLRIAALDTAQPLVQLDDYLFQGRYSEAIGTNLFFENVQTSRLSTDFRPTIRIQPIVQQTKIIELNEVKLKSQTDEQLANNSKSCSESLESSMLDAHFDKDYAMVIRNFRLGTLKLEDLLHEETMNVESCSHMEVDSNTELESTRQNILEETEVHEFDDLYRRLQFVGRCPTRRTYDKNVHMASAKCLPKYQQNYDYNNLQSAVLSGTELYYQQPIGDNRKTTIHDLVNVERCLVLGMITSDDLKSSSLETLKEQLVKIGNFTNLTLSGRLLVLHQYKETIHRMVNDTNENELKKRDKNGQTIADLYEIVNKLVSVLKIRVQNLTLSDL